MATLTLDTIQDALLDLSFQKRTHVVTGVIDGMDTSVDPRQLLWTAMDVLAANGYTLEPPTALSPAHVEMLFRRCRVQGIGSDSTRVWMYFESPDFGPPTAYILRHGSVLTGRETDLLPGTRTPIRIPGAVVTVTEGAISYSMQLRGDNVLMRFLFPLESIRVFALTYGSPKGAGGKFGSVNDAAWPVGQVGFDTYPKGYWILSRWETDYAKYSGYYTWEAEAMTRVNEDWSETGTLIDRRTGQHIPVDSATVAAMNALPYSQGIIYQDNGLVRVGAYPLGTFASIFGF